MPKIAIEKKIPNKIKFQSKFPVVSSDKPIILLYAVSKDNERQTKDNFGLFINWVIENKNKIITLKIILSDYLNRYYVGDVQALEWGRMWKVNNQVYLDKLKLLNVSYRLINWKLLLDKGEYSELRANIGQLYLNDQEFKTAVNGLAYSHQNKAGYDSAVNYLLEESAGLALLEGVLTYPAQKLNGAIHCALSKLNRGPTYIGHMFIYSKSIQDSRHALYKSAFNFLCALDQTGYKTKGIKNKFFFQCMKSHESIKHKKNFYSFSEELILRENLANSSNRKVFFGESLKDEMTNFSNHKPFNDCKLRRSSI